MDRKKIFSIPHFENALNALHDDTYYQMIKESSPKFKKEIHDIYFSKIFRYKCDGHDKIYGNPMGVEATDAQVDSLFRIQDELGIEISLTINSIETPHELFYEDSLIEAFTGFLKSFYDRGLRSCTLASAHIIRSGALHAQFPEMRWKNTVNHLVSNAQMVMDYIFCGYDTIMLDRSLCRNLSELKKIRKAVDHYNKTYKPDKKILTSLLAMEGCLSSCPFKKEHDSMGEQIGGRYFSTTSRLTCDNWRNAPFDQLPRNALDLIVSDKETLNEIARLTDIFKFSGRFTHFDFAPGEIGDRKACWVFFSNKQQRFDDKPVPLDEVAYSDNLIDPLNDDVLPLHFWRFKCTDPARGPYKEKLHILNSAPNFWKTQKGKRLSKILRNCRSQCWECHECEKAFETPSFESALQLH